MIEPEFILASMLTMRDVHGTTQWLAHEGFITEEDMDAVVALGDAVTKTVENGRAVYRLNPEWVERDREAMVLRRAIVERVGGLDLDTLRKVAAVLDGERARD